MRKYEPIWISIRDTGYCKISAHKALHTRIKKAVAKEKDMDLGYKADCLEATPPIEAIVRIKTAGSVLHFRLTKQPLITQDTI